jgi:tripartite-type tricarboxylate transporter receptor subunit TctC
MKLPRRKFLDLAAGAAAALPVMSRIAMAQGYPTRPVRLIAGVAAGGSPDMVARLMAQWLSERMGQPFSIDIRPGDGGNIATEAVVQASADGYTLLLVTPANAINATLYEKLNYNFIRDIAPVASFLRVPYVMVVNVSVPAKTVPEFIAYAKSNPGKVKIASTGNATPGHVAGELFKMMTGLNMPHVPYRGPSAALADLLGGQVQVFFGGIPASIKYIRAGELRPLAVTAAMQLEALPDVPTVREFLPGYEVSSVLGLGAPKATPIDVIDRLNKEINAGLVDLKIKARLAEEGGTTLPLSPTEFGTLIAEDTEKWGKVVKFAGIKPG